MRVLLAMAVALTACSDDPDCAREPCVVAGSGARGFDGDGRAARHTDLYLPTAARIGPDGLLWVMDFNNHRLRRVEASGRVSTVAGNGLHSLALDGVPATESPLENPVDFTFLPDDSAVLVPLHDPRVLRIAPDGTLHVVAGAGPQGDDGDGGPGPLARFRELTSVVAGPDGSIYLADALSHRVRVLHPDGTVHPFAGTGEEGNAGDGGPALDARLARPEALALGPDGDLYITDGDAGVVRRVDPDGTISTVARDLDDPQGVAVAADGRLYVSDTRRDRILVLPAAGGAPLPLGAGSLERPHRLSLSSTHLYVADTGHDRIVSLPLPP